VEKEDDYWSIFLDHDNQFKAFKSRMVDWINKVEADLRTLERNRVFKAASEKSSRSSRSSSMHSRSSASGSVRLAKAKEEQRIAELVAKQSTLEKRRDLEQKKLALKLQEEDLELETEIAIASARCKVLDDFQTVEEQFLGRLADFMGEGEPELVEPATQDRQCDDGSLVKKAMGVKQLDQSKQTALVES
jgi:hypothetical protein